MKKAVFTIITLRTSGQCAWWDEFPIAIGDRLKTHGIDHHVFFRAYENGSPFPLDERHLLTHEQANDKEELKKAMDPMIDQYDKVILHYHTFKYPSAMWQYHHKFNKKTHWFITDHDLWKGNEFSDIKRTVRQMLRKLGRLPEVIVGTSRASENRLRNLYGDKNVTHVTNGIKLPDIPKPGLVTKTPVKALYIGRLEEYKGLWPLIKAVEIALKKTKISLTVVGTGPLYDRLDEYVKSQALTPFVRLEGFVHDVSRVYQDHDFVIIPSLHNESFGLVSVEAQAHYLPCIYTDSGGMTETQINGQTGLQVTKNDSNAIANAIMELQSNIHKFNEMKINARRNAEIFTMDKMAEGYVDLYQEGFRS